jgi:hypothetical protein
MANRTLEELLEESRGEEPSYSHDPSNHLTWHRNMLQVADLRQSERARTRADVISDQINSTTFRR